MKKAGCVLGIIGLLLFAGSFTMFGSAIWRATKARTVMTVHLEPGQQIITEPFEVNTDKFCQIAVRMDIKTSSVQEEKDFDAVGYAGRYKFPVRYKVLDADGNAVFSENSQAAWNEGTRWTTGSEATNSGATMTIKHNFSKFKVPPPGDVLVEVEVGPDTAYGAEASNVTLKVYDNVSRHALSVLSGIVMLLVGPVMAIAGFVLFLIGLATKG